MNVKTAGKITILRHLLNAICAVMGIIVQTATLATTTTTIAKIFFVKLI